MPRPSLQSPSLYPDPLSIKEKAHLHSSQSKFFQLPPEVRQTIYLELWRSAGLAQHIFLQDGQYAHAPCITKHDVEETQNYFECLGIQKSWDVEVEDGLNKRRLQSPWCNHWKCEEAILRAQKAEGFGLLGMSENNATSARPSPLVLSPFLAALLTCKQMYVCVFLTSYLPTC